jgi:hypothetical protein
MTPPQGRRPRRTRPTVADSDRRYGPAATYRQLIVRGFASGEAANLTAYLKGLPIGTEPWTLRQVNTVLFLPRLRETGRFGAADGTPGAPAV